MTRTFSQLRRTLGLVLACGCVATPACWADDCSLVTRARAELAVELLGSLDTVLYENWFQPIEVHRVRLVRSGSFYQSELDDGKALDLNSVYVLGDDDSQLDNLGVLLGCPATDGPKRIPRTPFSDSATAAFKPESNGRQAIPALVGLLELPELERAWYSGTEVGSAKPMDVYKGPNRGSAVQQTIRSMSDLPFHEYGYEQPGARVLESQEGWYRIQLKSGTGWVSGKDTGDLHTLTSLFTDSLTHLTAEWNGRLQDSPRASKKSRWLHSAWRQHMSNDVPINVIDTRRVDDQLWLRVEVIWPGPCSGNEPVVQASGWIPAQNKNETMNLWFSSRGC